MPRRRRAARGPKRQTRWLTTRKFVDISDTGQDVTSLLEAEVIATVYGMTVLRSILTVRAMPTTVAGVNGRQIMDFGMGVISQEELASLSVPDPNQVEDRPSGGWMLLDRLLVIDGIGDDAAPMMVTRSYDLKGRRKVGYGELVMICVSSNESGSAFTVSWHVDARILVALP